MAHVILRQGPEEGSIYIQIQEKNGIFREHAFQYHGIVSTKEDGKNCQPRGFKRQAGVRMLKDRDKQLGLHVILSKTIYVMGSNQKTFYHRR